MATRNPGQLFMTGLPGLSLDEATRALVRKYRVGNFILFRRNIAEAAQLAELNAQLRSLCAACDLPPPLIAIDQEGGSVSRLPPPFRQFGDARLIGKAADPAAAAAGFAIGCADELRSVGINMNLAPVLDICPAGEGCVMDRRCLSDDPVEAAQLGSIIISRMQSRDVAACAKHFPGLGSIRIDPHHRLPRVDKPAADLLREDLLPFIAAIEAEVAAIMTSHTVYTNMDGRVPATLSPPLLSGLLRKRLGYRGLIVTDDLEMGAIVEDMSVPQASLRAFLAGADLLLVCEHQEKVGQACALFADALSSGVISDERFDASLATIARVQQRFAATAEKAGDTLADNRRTASA
ncbi:MAG: glycoside hydrolase family 3 N-terminal domain-containing protein [Thermodesulfobacteriota bacterium]